MIAWQKSDFQQYQPCTDSDVDSASIVVDDTDTIDAKDADDADAVYIVYIV